MTPSPNRNGLTRMFYDVCAGSVRRRVCDVRMRVEGGSSSRAGCESRRWGWSPAFTSCVKYNHREVGGLSPPPTYPVIELANQFRGTSRTASPLRSTSLIGVGLAVMCNSSTDAKAPKKFSPGDPPRQMPQKTSGSHAMSAESRTSEHPHNFPRMPPAQAIRGVACCTIRQAPAPDSLNLHAAEPDHTSRYVEFHDRDP